MTSGNGAKRAAIYTRLSKDREGAGVKVEEQERQCREVATLRGLTVNAVYSDNDMTAATRSKRYKPRDGYAAMLAALRDGRADAVLAWHTDRIHRDMRELEEYIDACGVDPGIPTYTVLDGDLDLSTSGGRMVARIKAAVALQEVEHLAERVKNGKARIRAEGRWPGGKVPFGYRAEDRKLIVVEAEAEQVRAACAMLLAGWTLYGIVRDLNARPPAGGRPRKWNPFLVRGVCTAARNAGLIEHYGKIMDKGDWEPIISEDTLIACRALLADPKRHSGGPGPRRRWLLSGIARCGRCGSQNTRVHKLTNGRRGYTCRDCFGVSRDAERTDAAVEAVIITILRQPDFAAALRPRTDVPALDTRRAALRARLDELGALFGAGDIDGQQLAAGSKPIAAQLAEVEDEIGAAYRDIGLDDLAGGPDPVEAWNGLDLDRRRAVIRALIDITILPIKKAADRKMGPQPDWKVGTPWFDVDSIRIEQRFRLP